MEGQRSVGGGSPPVTPGVVTPAIANGTHKLKLTPFMNTPRQRYHLRMNRPLRGERVVLERAKADDERRLAVLEQSQTTMRKTYRDSEVEIAKHTSELAHLSKVVDAIRPVRDMLESTNLHVDSRESILQHHSLSSEVRADPCFKDVIRIFEDIKANLESNTLSIYVTIAGFYNKKLEIERKLEVAQASRAWAEEYISQWMGETSVIYARLERTRSQLGPISCIPDEIWKSIFDHVLEFVRKDDISPDDFYREWEARATLPEMTLSHACYRWRSIMLDNPSLWRNVCISSLHDDSRFKLVQHLKARAMQAPLRIIMQLEDHDYETEDASYRAYLLRLRLMLLFDSSECCYSITVSCKSMHKCVNEILEPLPKTRQLRVIVHDQQLEATSLIVPTEMCQSLYGVFLYGCLVERDAFHGARLTHLTLLAFQHCGFTLEDICSKSLSTLQSLSLSSLPPDDGPKVRLSLPRLKHLRCGIHALIRLLDSFLLPTLQRIIISEEEPDEWEELNEKLVRECATNLEVESPFNEIICKSLLPSRGWLIPFVLSLRSLGRLQIEGEAVDHMLKGIRDEYYKNTIMLVKKRPEFEGRLVIRSYKGDGLEILRFVSLILVRSLTLRHCSNIPDDVRRLIAQYTTLVIE